MGKGTSPVPKMAREDFDPILKAAGFQRKGNERLWWRESPPLIHYVEVNIGSYNKERFTVDFRIGYPKLRVIDRNNLNKIDFETIIFCNADMLVKLWSLL